MINFEDRRLTDPQGVIDDLLIQITQQALALHEAGEARKVADLAQAVLDGRVKAPKKATAGRKKSDEA